MSMIKEVVATQEAATTQTSTSFGSVTIAMMTVVPPLRYWISVLTGPTLPLMENGCIAS